MLVLEAGTLVFLRADEDSFFRRRPMNRKKAAITTRK